MASSFAPVRRIRFQFASFAICFLCLFLSACSSPSPSGDDPAVESESSESSPASDEAANAKANEPAPSTASDATEVEVEQVAITEENYNNPLTPEQQSEGWISLFDGVSLFGWESTNPETNWSVSNGAITASEGPVGFLMTTVPYADYELICEYRTQTGTNSGLFLRTEFPPGNIKTDCYEVNIADEHPNGFLTGSLVNREKTSVDIPTNNEWNTFQIAVNGDQVDIHHNDQQVLSYNANGTVAPLGRIALQKNFGKIEFRKLIVRPLNLTSLFNGTDLTNWREVPDSKSQFTVEDSTIHVQDGAGFLETEETYKNFIFQADAKTHAAELNSGFFFRAETGTAEAPSNGYEFQIHNGFDESRGTPNNSGTGAIFRRVDARYVVADDNEWFTSTLITYGPRICCWVNGYQVVDWVDTRKPDPNPRRGLRVEAGHLSLQGHDPTTDLSFQNLKIAEFPTHSKSDE
ncbi:DUF1080 domain-containing protein [Thalassoglobus sp. JC818]|uniref:3-keto-disaccharide hydrolase n=1 Tax=Thalassoglobus sp. JC818 TaxID=3232136 RepID=UPI003457F4E0